MKHKSDDTRNLNTHQTVWKADQNKSTWKTYHLQTEWLDNVKYEISCNTGSNASGNTWLDKDNNNLNMIFIQTTQKSFGLD